MRAKGTVLVVDDDLRFLQTIREVLQEDGYEVAATVGAVHFDEYGGVVATDKKVGKCEKNAAMQVAKAVKKLTACHMKRALGKGDEAAEEACEKGVTDAFDSKVHGCAAAPCLDKLMGSTISFITDGQSGRVYCSGTTPFGDE